MKKTFLSFLAITLLITAESFAAVPPPAFDYTKCSSAGADTKGCRSRAKRKIRDTKKCEKIASEDEKEKCLQQVDEKYPSKSK